MRHVWSGTAFGIAMIAVLVARVLFWNAR